MISPKLWFVLKKVLKCVVKEDSKKVARGSKEKVCKYKEINNETKKENEKGKTIIDKGSMQRDGKMSEQE